MLCLCFCFFNKKCHSNHLVKATKPTCWSALVKESVAPCLKVLPSVMFPLGCNAALPLEKRAADPAEAPCMLKISPCLWQNYLPNCHPSYISSFLSLFPFFPLHNLPYVLPYFFSLFALFPCALLFFFLLYPRGLSGVYIYITFGEPREITLFPWV